MASATVEVVSVGVVTTVVSTGVVTVVSTGVVAVAPARPANSALIASTDTP